MPQGKHRVRAMVRRIRGGENELIMTNGRIGRQQQGVIFIKQMELTGPHGTPASFRTLTHSAVVRSASTAPTRAFSSARRAERCGDVA